MGRRKRKRFGRKRRNRFILTNFKKTMEKTEEMKKTESNDIINNIIRKNLPLYDRFFQIRLEEERIKRKVAKKELKKEEL
jgi:hypothetical protein